MLEIIFGSILCSIFYLTHKHEQSFQKKRHEYIDDSRVFLPEDK